MIQTTNEDMREIVGVLDQLVTDISTLHPTSRTEAANQFEMIKRIYSLTAILMSKDGIGLYGAISSLIEDVMLARIQINTGCKMPDFGYEAIPDDSSEILAARTCGLIETPKITHGYTVFRVNRNSPTYRRFVELKKIMTLDADRTREQAKIDKPTP